MDQTNVGNGTQETETGLLSTATLGATLTLRAVEDRLITSPPTAEPPEAPAVNSHLLSDADVKLFQQGTHCRLHEKLGAHPVTVSAGEMWQQDNQRMSGFRVIPAQHARTKGKTTGRAK